VGSGPAYQLGPELVIEVTFAIAEDVDDAQVDHVLCERFSLKGKGRYNDRRDQRCSDADENSAERRRRVRSHPPSHERYADDAE